MPLFVVEQREGAPWSTTTRLIAQYPRGRPVVCNEVWRSSPPPPAMVLCEVDDCRISEGPDDYQGCHPNACGDPGHRAYRRSCR